MEPLSIEDPRQKAEARSASWARPKNLWLNRFMAALFGVSLLSCAFLLGVVFGRTGRTLGTFMGEVRVHVHTYFVNKHETGIDMTTGDLAAVEWRSSMPTEETMRTVARDGSLGTTDTAFVCRRSGNQWDVMFYSKGGVRYVSSGKSVSAAVYAMYVVFDEDPEEEIILHTPGSKPIVATIDNENRVTQTVDTEGQVKFVCRPLAEVVHRLDETIGDETINQFEKDVIASLGISSESLADEADGNIWVFHLGTVVLVKSKEILQDINPDWVKVKKLKVPGDTKNGWSYNPGAEFTHTRNLVVAFVGELDDPVNFLYRHFCPRLGVNEDPVTGEGMAAMITLFSQIREKTTSWLKAEQASYQPGYMEGTWDFDRYSVIDVIKYRGTGSVIRISSLPLKYEDGQPY